MTGGSTSGDDRSAWEHDSTAADLSKSDPETYAIPGGLSGWTPGSLPVPRSDGTFQRPVVAREVDEAARPAKPARKAASEPRSEWLVMTGFNALVFIGSICVMTLELTASRLIAKHVGSSLYTWTSVIGVVLAGITIGNYLGGWLADRFDRARTLSWMFLAASLSCAGVLWLDQIITGWPRPEVVSWPMWILCLVAMMFLTPAVLLGTTSPLVASMALARSSRLGQTVGNVYAWGAFGSIVGTFLTGFYLIDVWGTRSIVGLTSGVLAALAVAVAGGRGIFRAAVVCGWMQLLGVLCIAATITRPSGVACGGIVAQSWTWTMTQADATNSRIRWEQYGGSLGEKLQELGGLLHLRDDKPGLFYDESSYSYLHVGDDYLEGSPVKYLRLDKLIHAYYNPDEPTKLHYEYEQVYAAVTKASAPRPEADASVTLSDFPGRAALLEELPEGVTWEASSQRLWVHEPTPELLDTLRGRSPSASYWKAVETLHHETTKPRWGGFSTASLSALPDGVTIPEDVFRSFRFDPHLEVLSAYDAISTERRDQLIALSPQAPWYQAIESLRNRSVPLSALFLGGGGYIFPRWFLVEFPHAQHVDVAELDPAVHAIVQQELGLTPADEERIKTTIGDARNFIDDRLRANDRLKATKQEPVLYDYIYGDAFNDFSVPWHLTTVEFNQKVASLLTSQGVFQANIIDMYPRTTAPDRVRGHASIGYDADFPAHLLEQPANGRLPKLLPKCAPLVVETGSLERYQLSAQAVITPSRLARLQALAPEHPAWQSAVRQLSDKTLTLKPAEGELPKALEPSHHLLGGWEPCEAPFRGVEVQLAEDNGWILGFRGTVTPELEARLLALKPQDTRWTSLITDAAHRSRKLGPGAFLGRYVKTLASIYPCVYIFSTAQEDPTNDRDTFVAVCSWRPLDLDRLGQTGYWTSKPFAAVLRRDGQTEPELIGQMEVLLAAARGPILTDDFAPVENLMLPVFSRQDD